MTFDFRAFLAGTTAFFALSFLGAGCVPISSTTDSAAGQPAVGDQAVQDDPYAGWNEIRPGDVISIRIPSDCVGDPGAGNIWVTCGADRWNEIKTVMHTSSDGLTVNVNRGAIADWSEWDKAIASIRVLAPLGRDVRIEIRD